MLQEQETFKKLDIAVIGQRKSGKSTVLFSLDNAARCSGMPVRVSHPMYATRTGSGITVILNEAEYTDSEKGLRGRICEFEEPEEFIRALISGIFVPDVIWLVMSAELASYAECETMLEAAGRVGVRSGAFVLNKADSGIREYVLEYLENEYNALFARHGFDVSYSCAIEAEALIYYDPEDVPANPAVRRHMEDNAARLAGLFGGLRAPAEDTSAVGKLRLTAETVSAAEGKGTIVSGRISGGSVFEGDLLDICCGSSISSACVRGIAQEDRRVTFAGIGDPVSLLFGEYMPGLSAGSILCSHGAFILTQRIEALIYSLSAKECGMKEDIGKDCRTEIRLCGIVTGCSPTEIIPSGEHGATTLETDVLVPVKQGDRFEILNDGNVIAIGLVLGTGATE